MKNRINSIDIIRVVAAFFIICIHCHAFYGNDFIIPISRIAVPLFLMISGFFWTFGEKESRKKQVVYVVVLALSANGIYLAYKIFLSLFFGGTISMLKDVFSINSILNFVIFNESPVGYHLWYLSALLYCLLIYDFFEFINMQKILYFSIPILLATDLIFGKYSVLISGKDFPHIYVRNFLFVGMPYFGIGNLLSKYKENITKINDFLIISLMVLFTFTTFAEKFFLITVNANASREHYISTTLLSVLLFVYALKHPLDNKNKVVDKMALLGRKYTLAIYIIHPIIIQIIDKIIERTNLIIQKLYYYTEPIVIFFVTLTYAIFYFYLKDKVIHLLFKNK